MKRLYVILFLLFAFLYASQAQTNCISGITAYRLINEYDDGPCNILSYIKEGVPQDFIQKREVDDCSGMVLALLELEKESENWKKEPYDCNGRCIGCKTIPIMLVLENAGQKHTFFFSFGLDAIFDPQQQVIFIDVHKDFKKLISTNAAFRDLFETDFDEIIKRRYHAVSDSVDAGKIKINHKSLYGMKRSETDNSIEGFDEIVITKSQHEDWVEHFTCKKYNSEFTFIADHPISEIKLNDFNFKDYELGFILDMFGVNPGDTKEKLIKKFPLSCENIDAEQKYFSDAQGFYSISVKLTNHQGWIDFTLKDEMIYSIKVKFEYPNQ